MNDNIIKIAKDSGYFFDKADNCIEKSDIFSTIEMLRRGLDIEFDIEQANKLACLYFYLDADDYAVNFVHNLIIDKKANHDTFIILISHYMNMDEHKLVKYYTDYCKIHFNDLTGGKQIEKEIETIKKETNYSPITLLEKESDKKDRYYEYIDGKMMFDVVTREDSKNYAVNVEKKEKHYTFELIFLAVNEYKLGNKEKAITFALEIYNNNEAPLVGAFLLYYFSAIEDNFDDATKAYYKKLHNVSAFDMFLIADCLELFSTFNVSKEGLKVYEMILEIMPYNLDFKNSYILYCCKVGEYERAIPHCNDFIKAGDPLETATSLRTVCETKIGLDESVFMKGFPYIYCDNSELLYIQYLRAQDTFVTTVNKILKTRNEKKIDVLINDQHFYQSIVYLVRHNYAGIIQLKNLQKKCGDKVVDLVMKVLKFTHFDDTLKLTLYSNFAEYLDCDEIVLSLNQKIVSMKLPQEISNINYKLKCAYFLSQAYAYCQTDRISPDIDTKWLADRAVALNKSNVLKMIKKLPEEELALYLFYHKCKFKVENEELETYLNDDKIEYFNMIDDEIKKN